MSSIFPVCQIYQDAAGQWRWRLKGANGRKVAASGEAFASRRNAERAFNRVLEIAANVVEFTVQAKS